MRGLRFRGRKKLFRWRGWVGVFFVESEQSLFPLNDGGGKRTLKRQRKWPDTLKRDARVELPLCT